MNRKGSVLIVLGTLYKSNVLGMKEDAGWCFVLFVVRGGMKGKSVRCIEDKQGCLRGFFYVC